MKKATISFLIAGTVLFASACESAPPSSEHAADTSGRTDSLATRCGAPDTATLAAIASRFDPQFNDQGLLEAVQYRIDGDRSVVSATVKRPTETNPGTPTAWLMSGDTVEQQLTGRVDLANPLGDFVALPPPLPGGNAEQWEFEWRDCDSVVPNDKRTSWTPTRSADLSDAPPPCEGAEPLDKVPGIEFELKPGFKLIDIYRPYAAYPRGSVLGGNIADRTGKVVARGAVWQFGASAPQSANQTAAEYSSYRRVPFYNVKTNDVAVVERCSAAVPH